MEGSKEISMDQLFIKKLNNTVFENLHNEQFGVEGLASQIGLSRSQIHRKLKEINGKSVTQFIREIRLKEAHRLLENNVGTASEIAYQVGFGSPTYFNKCFHEYYGYTPGEVKERQNPNGRKRGIISTKHLWPTLMFVLLLVIFYFMYVFLSGNDSKFSNPQASQNESADVLKANSVAVIPFTNLSDDPNQDHFCNGMTDEIIVQLSKAGDIFVKSEYSFTRFANPELSIQEIGKAFDVATILRGSIRKAGDMIRITAQLFNANSGAVIWSEGYEANISNLSRLFFIQKDVAQNVAHKLKSTTQMQEAGFPDQKPISKNSLAYEYYLKGNEYYRSGAGEILALESYSKAIREDSLFVAAYARKAVMHAHLYFSKKTDDWVTHDQIAINSIERAKQLDSVDIEVKIAQAVYHYYIDRNYQLGIGILNEIKEYAPNMSRLYAYVSFMKVRQGKWDEGIRELNLALEFEPFNVEYIKWLSVIYARLRDFDTSIQIAREGLDKVPDYNGFRRRIFTATRKKTGDLKMAMDASGLDKNDWPFVYYSYSRQFDELIKYIRNEHYEFLGSNNFHPMSYELALAYYYNGDTVMSKIYADSAIQLLEKKLAEYPFDHRLPAPLSKCYAILGDREQAINYGKQSVSALPVKADELIGRGKETEMAKTYILIGDYDHAMDQIEYLLSVPGFLTVGDLWTRPIYYELRRLPRFHEILRAHQPDSLYQSMVNQNL